MNELAIIEKLRELAERGPHITLGIGDDFAIYRPRRGEDLLFKIDPMIENVHFRREQPPAIIGQRALARNLSDIAAMVASLIFVWCRSPSPANSVKSGFGAFIADYCNRRGAPARRSPAVTWLAPKRFTAMSSCAAMSPAEKLYSAAEPVLATLYVSGRLGKPWDRRITPRLALGKALCGKASSCIDLSDGLSLDLYRLCLASGDRWDIDHVPVMRRRSLSAR